MLHKRDEKPAPTKTPTIVNVGHITPEPDRGALPKLRVALTRAQLDRALDGDILRFIAQLPDRSRVVHLLRDDIKPLEPAPDVRLRVAPGALEGVRMGGTVTPLAAGIPFELQLTLATGETPTPAAPVRIGSSVVRPPIDPRADKEDPVGATYSTMGAGAFMLIMGAIRAAAATHQSSTNTFMMLIGGGMIAYGAFRWLTLR